MGAIIVEASLAQYGTGRERATTVRWQPFQKTISKNCGALALTALYFAAERVRTPLPVRDISKRALAVIWLLPRAHRFPSL